MFAGAMWGLWVYIFSVMAVDTEVSPVPGSLGLLVAIPAVYTCLAALLTRRIGFAPLFLAYAWMGVEFALAPLGLKGGLLASAHGEGLLADSVGRLFGYVFVAFLLVGANASVLAVLSNARLRIPRQGILIGLPDSGAYRLSRMIACVPVLPPPCEAYPRAPPIAAHIRAGVAG